MRDGNQRIRESAVGKKPRMEGAFGHFLLYHMLQDGPTCRNYDHLSKTSKFRFLTLLEETPATVLPSFPIDVATFHD